MRSAFFSIADGNWNQPSSWSTQGYGGAASNTFPTGTNKVFIGDGKTITLDSDRDLDNSVVTLDSSGYFKMEGWELSGSSSTFYMFNDAVLGIGHPDGITASAASGNLQFLERNYNAGDDYVEHNRGHFVYNGSVDQVTGDGLPNTADSVFTLTIENTGASGTNVVSLTNNINVKDSLHIIDGELDITGENIALHGNWRIEDDGSFNGGSGTETFSFTGFESQTVTAPDDLTFRILQVNKTTEFTYVQFASNTVGSQMIYIYEELQFPSDNMAYINLSSSLDASNFPDYGSGEWVMQIDENSNGIDRDGNGHIMGEIRKYVDYPGDDVTWEVGALQYYRPFTLYLLESDPGESDGYVGVHQIDTLHPHHTYLDNPTDNYPPNRMLKKYWRVTRPDYSSYSRGSNETEIEVEYIDPTDMFASAQKLCFDLAFWYGPDADDWQTLTPPDNDPNDGGAIGCGDRNVNNSEADYPPYGTNTSTRAYDISDSDGLRDRDIGNNRYLLGDVIVCQQGPAITYYYAKNDGDWTDPNTWVTGSYESTVNDGSPDQIDGNPNGGPEDYPKRRLDAAIIGNGVTVTLDANIGHGYAGWDTFAEWYEQRVGSVVVETYDDKPGKLVLGTNIIKTNLFELRDGGILETGCEEGFSDEQNRGNIRRQYGGGNISRDFNVENHNNGNYIFKPKGKITEIYDNDNPSDYEDECYCNPRDDWQSDERNIDNVEVCTGTVYNIANRIFNHENTGWAGRGFWYYADYGFELEPDEDYTIRVTLGGSGSTNGYDLQVWLDEDYSGDFDITGERIYNNTNLGGSTVLTFNFTVGANTLPGTTQIRIRLDESNGAPCDDGNPDNSGDDDHGEVHDYTVNIIDNSEVITQETGDGIPDEIGFMRIDAINDASTVSLTQDVNCSSTFAIEQGDFVLGTNTLTLQDDFINNSGGTAFSGLSGIVSFNGDNPNQYIRGNSSSTFGTILMEKSSGAVNLSIDTKIENEFTFNADNLFNLGANTLYLAENISDINSNFGSFGNSRMVQTNGSSALSKLVKEFPTVSADPEPGGYCTPNSNSSVYIDYFKFGSLENTSGNDGGYADNTGIGYETAVIGTNNIQFSKSSTDAYNWRVFIDLNRDGDFDDNVGGVNEHQFIDNFSGSGNHSGSFDIPAAASRGYTRIRIKCRPGGNTDPCQTGGTGEFEDYLILIPPVGGSDLSAEFLYPIGLENSYNPAYISAESSSYSSNPSISVGLIDGLHPQRYTDDMLEVYWPVETEGIYNFTSTSASFTYETADVNGDIDYYIPAKFNTEPPWIYGWENNLGVPVGVDSDNNLFYAEDTPQEVGLTGDWTAGTAPSFFIGRIYYSIASGSWTDPNRWSNYGHQSFPASYYPGELYNNDSVFVDGHTVAFNADTATVFFLSIGGSNTVAQEGILQYDDNLSGKHLTVSSTFTISEDGILNRKASAAGKDTLTFRYNIYNTAADDAAAGIYLYENDTDYTVLRFLDADPSVTTTVSSSTITGEGNWGDLREIILAKGGLSDTLYNLSNSFSEAAVNSPASYIFKPDAGVFSHHASSTMSISGGATQVSMEAYSGFDIQNSAILSLNGLSTNVNTSINLDGGNFYIGDAADENLTYRTGTTVNITDGFLDIAGAFKRNSSGSSLIFNMTENGETRVMSEGNTNPSTVGFDISSSASDFSMSGGRIIVAKGHTGSVPDIRINAESGAGMTGGTIQLGDNSIASSETIKTAGSMPIWNLHSVGAGQTSQIVEEYYTIKNDWIVDDNNTMQLRGNTAELQGDFRNSGTFDATTGSGGSDQRLVILSNPSSTQTLYNKTGGGLQFYNLRIDKTGGLVQLDSDDNSNIIINGTLEFASGNNSLIDARSGGKYVELSPSDGSSPQTLRNGDGWVDGRMCRYIEPGAPKNYYYDIGSSTFPGYTPAAFEPEGSITNGGYVCIIAYPFDHPQIASSSSETMTNIQRYWNVNGRDGYDLDNQTYELMTQWLYPEDDRGGSYFSFEHKRYTPACPDPPASCSFGTGEWYEAATPTKAQNYIISTGSGDWGDFIVTEPLGEAFYSIDDGNWNVPGVWSKVGYGGPASSTTPGERDFVYIGDGKTITVPEGLRPTVRSVAVERGSATFEPGALYIKGTLGAVRCQSFILNDDCTLGMQHLNGIAPLSDGTVGAVQSTASREFLISNYVYDFYNGSQNTGKGMPQQIASIQVKNTTPSDFNNVFVTNPVGAPTINVRDSVLIENGKLNTSDRNFELQGSYIIANNGEYIPLTNDFSFNGSSHTVMIGNQNGISFYNVSIDQGDVYVMPYHGSTSFTPLADDSLQIYVNNELVFNSPARIITRDYDREVVIRDGAVLTQNQTGYVDGTLQKPVGSGTGNTYFEIGNGSVYTPATLIFDSGSGTAGSVEATNYAPVPDERFIGNRMDPSVHIDRWWELIPQDGLAYGTREPNVRLQFPYNELSGIGGELTENLERSIIRRRSIPTQNPEYSERKYAQLIWRDLDGDVLNGDGVQDPGEDSVRVEINAGYPGWAGLGEFYIGKKFQRIFYSRQSGGWSENATWSFEGHDGAIAPTGEYPNMDPLETEDDVRVGDDENHLVEMTANTSATIYNLDVYGNAKLDMNGSVIESSKSGSFTLGHPSFEAVYGTEPFLTSDNDGFPEINILNFGDYYVGLNSTVEYDASNTQPVQYVTSLPFANDIIFSLPEERYYGNIEFSGTGTKYVTISPTIVRGDARNNNSFLYILVGTNSFWVKGNVINSGFINNNGVIEIGQ